MPTDDSRRSTGKTIPIVASTLPPGFKGVDALESAIPFIQDVDTRVIADSMKAIVGYMRETLDGLEADSRDFTLSSVEVEAAVLADGRIGFLSSHIAAGARNSLKFTWQHRGLPNKDLQPTAAGEM